MTYIIFQKLSVQLFYASSLDFFRANDVFKKIKGIFWIYYVFYLWASKHSKSISSIIVLSCYKYHILLTRTKGWWGRVLIYLVKSHQEGIWHGVVVHTWNSSTQEFNFSLVYIMFKASQSHRGDPVSKTEKAEWSIYKTSVFLWPQVMRPERNTFIEERKWRCSFLFSSVFLLVLVHEFYDVCTFLK